MEGRDHSLLLQYKLLGVLQTSFYFYELLLWVHTRRQTSLDFTWRQTSTVRSRLRYVRHMSSTGKINACNRAGQHVALKECICGPWSPEYFQ